MELFHKTPESIVSARMCAESLVANAKCVFGHSLRALKDVTTGARDAQDGQCLTNQPVPVPQSGCKINFPLAIVLLLG